MKKILFVDDEKINLMLFKVNFRKKFVVLTAENVNEAISLLEENSDIELVVTDMKMPGMDGIEFARLVHQKFPGKDVYLLTGFGLLPEIENAISEGIIQSYIGKPLNFKEIESVLGVSPETN